MLIAHDEPAARLVPHVLEPMTNADAFVPVVLIEVMGSAVFPALLRVNTSALLMLPVVTLPKSADAGVSAACGADV